MLVSGAKSPPRQKMQARASGAVMLQTLCPSGRNVVFIVVATLMDILFWPLPTLNCNPLWALLMSGSERTETFANGRAKGVTLPIVRVANSSQHPFH
jgi:hypothetical protein